MTKHVFEPSYGSLWHRGALVGETNKTYKIMTNGGRTSWTPKGDKIIIETDDPTSPVKAWDEARKPYDVMLQSFKDQMKFVQEEQRAACLKAIGGSLT